MMHDVMCVATTIINTALIIIVSLIICFDMYYCCLPYSYYYCFNINELVLMVLSLSLVCYLSGLGRLIGWEANRVKNRVGFLESGENRTPD